jgi:hypothetical protein
MTIKQSSLIILSFVCNTLTVASDLATNLRFVKNEGECRLDRLYSDPDGPYANLYFEAIERPDGLWWIGESHPDLSPEDHQKISNEFYTELQKKSEDKAREKIKKLIEKNQSKEAAKILALQNFLCEKIIQSPGCDCAAVHQDLKQRFFSTHKKNASN